MAKRTPRIGRDPRRMAGLTLTELMITLAVGGILVAIAVPNMGTFMQNSARASRVNSLVTALTLARSEAVTRGVSVTICPAAIGNNDCTPVASGGEWVYQDGWLITTAIGSTPIRQFEIDAGDNVTLLAELSQFTFSPLGQAGNGAGMANGTYFRYCDTRGDDEARAVLVNAVGRSEASPMSNSRVTGAAVPACP